jgi:alpha-L-fucosidase
MAIPTPEKRIADFENLGFGMFIHWGLYSQRGQGEWTQCIHRIPKEEYVKLQDTFTAEKFDARRIARIAKAAGAKYITLTTRHHEGFSLYDTCGLNTYDALHAPCGRDLIREFVDACNEQDILPMFYHTTLDWYNPDFNGDFPKYLKYLRDSVEILCTRYGKIGGLWFDGNWSKPGADWEEDALYETIRKHQPEAMIINNTGLSDRGEIGNPQLDSVTFEQGRPTPMDREGHKKYVAAEMCHTMNNHWGFGAHDCNYKSLAHLIETLCACRKVGANYLLNVGPTGEGEIPLMQEALLRGIGDWIRATGNVIYTAKPCGVTALGESKDFALRDGNKLYFFIHGLRVSGDGNVVVERGGDDPFGSFTGIPGKIKSLRWTDTGYELSFTQDGDKISANFTHFPYGSDLVVRVAEAELE